MMCGAVMTNFQLVSFPDPTLSRTGLVPRPTLSRTGLVPRPHPLTDWSRSQIPPSHGLVSFPDSTLSRTSLVPRLHPLTKIFLVVLSQQYREYDIDNLRDIVAVVYNLTKSIFGHALLKIEQF